MQVPDEIKGGDDFTIKQLAQTCLGENARRLAPYDARLLRPRLVPSLVGLGLRFLPG